MENSGCFPTGKASCDRVTLVNLRCMLSVFQYFHNPPNSDMDYMMFIVRKDASVCDCTRGCKDTVRESALKVDCGREISCRTGESNLPQRRAGPTLCQLSYIPTHTRDVHLFASNFSFTNEELETVGL